MTRVYIAEHVYEVNDEDHAKVIGVFSTHKKAQDAVDNLLLKPGFADHPAGFTIDEYELDVEGNFSDGFVTL